MNHPFVTGPATWLAAAIITILVSLPYKLDAPDDHSAEWPSSAELKALQASQAGTQRREAAAQALCLAERGPQSEARWTPDGDLVCTLQRNANQINHTTLTTKAQL